MFVLFQLLVQIVITCVYTLLYAAITLAILVLLANFNRFTFLNTIKHQKFKSFINICGAYFVILGIYSFVHFGEKGEGDYYLIPISKDYAVKNIDGADTYFEENQNDYGRQAYLKKFIIKDGKLCSSFTGFNSPNCKDCYFVFDSQTKKQYEFHSTSEYLNFASQNNLPTPDKFKDFSTNYDNYWSARKNWLLP